MPLIRCPRCGEEGDLQGHRVGDTIEITCGRCSHAWVRDKEPSCPKCGGAALRAFSEPLIQKARGTAYSVVGERAIYLCEVCEADEIENRTPAEKIIQAPLEDPWK